MTADTAAPWARTRVGVSPASCRGWSRQMPCGYASYTGPAVAHPGGWFTAGGLSPQWSSTNMAVSRDLRYRRHGRDIDVELVYRSAL